MEPPSDNHGMSDQRPRPIASTNDALLRGGSTLDSGKGEERSESVGPSPLLQRKIARRAALRRSGDHAGPGVVVARKEDKDGKGGKDKGGPKALNVDEAATRVTDLLSYGVFDWAVTDGETLEVVQILTALSPPDRRRVLTKIGPQYVSRLVDNMPAEKADLFADLVPGKETKPGEKLDDKIKGTPNQERAAVALTELRAKQSGEKRTPRRLTSGIIELLVWGVARPTNPAGGDKGQEGILGIEQAGRAADALIAMPDEAYFQIVAKLVMTGGDDKAADARTESLLILKAVAARKDEFTKGKDGATDEVSDFADKIRGGNAEALKERTTVRDYGATTGLQQKFTMTCGPTSIQMVHGEADPVFALQVSETAKHNLDFDNSVGKQQADYLGKSTIPRVVWDAWKTFKTWLGGLPLPDKPKGQALHKWIQGQPFDATKRDEGAALANTAGYSNDRLDQFKKHFPFSHPGWQNSDFAAKANEELNAGTGGKHDERAIPPNYQNIAGKMTPISTMAKADVDAMYEKLFRGVDVPMGIMWSKGGGHFMVFTDCKKAPDGKREFLLSDPWKGESAWITEANVLSGNLAPFGTGAIDSLYL